MKKLLLVALAVMMTITGANAIKKKSSGKTGPFFECYSMEKYDGIENAVQVRIGGGAESGFYIGGAQRLTTVMGMNNSRPGHHWGCAEVTTGAQGNINAIEDGIANAGFIQGNDELRLYTEKKYEGFMTGKVILPTKQTEAVLMVMPNGKDEDNLEDKNVKVYIGSKTGGNLSVLNHLKLLNTDMKNVQAVSYEELFGEDAETDDYFGPEILDLLAQGKFQAILRVTVVKPGSKFIKRVIDHEKIEFTSVNDSSFDNKVKIGDKKIQIFELDTIVLDFDGWNTKVETPVMPIKLLVDKANMNPKAYRQLRDSLEYTNFKPFK